MSQPARTRTYISLVERGLRSPKLDTIFRLAEALGVAPSEVVRHTESAVRAAATPASE